MENLRCLRCGTAMVFVGRERLQMGKTGWVLGDLPNLVAGALEVEIYACPRCRKLEFFRPEELSVTEANALPLRECPACGHLHEFDFPKCPLCGFDYYGGR